jgi:hypothetical protein
MTAPVVVHKPAHLLVPPGRGVAVSTNWSGYAAKNTTFSDVKGSWVQPAVSCTSNKRQYSAFWVGIDGYSSNTVEQIGTDSDCVGRGASYYAWYEMYPAGSMQIPFSVFPGDTLSADVAVSGNTFTLTLSSSRRGYFTISKTSPTAAKSSAEWVGEAPSICIRTCSVLPLANFGTVNFSGSSATSTGVSRPITSFTNDKIIMETNRGTVKAAPSSLSPSLSPPGDAFADTWQHS